MARVSFLRACFAMSLLFTATGLVFVSGTVVGAEEAKSADVRATAPVHFYEAEGAQRRLLDRFESYLDREQWDDALECAAALLQDDSHAVVAIEDHRYVSVGEYVHQRLAKLPAAALAEYRELVDAPAETWYRQGIAERDQQLLSRVVDEMFCSSWGDDALFALGELALEQGEYQTARAYWSRISTELLPSAMQSVLFYPDTDLNLADVRARLVLVSLYEGDLARAQEEIEAFSALYKTARGRLGGQDTVYAEALTEMLQQSATWERRPQNGWPTYAGSATRSNASLFFQQVIYKKLWSQSLGDSPEVRPNTFPVVVGKLLLYQNASQVVALDLETGERVFVSEGVTFQSPMLPEDDLRRPCYTLSGNTRYIFGTTASQNRSRRGEEPASNSASLWGIDLRRDGAVWFQQQPEEVNSTFAGAPVVDDDRLWVALQSSGLTARAGIACYDLATGEQVWRSWICRANVSATGWANQRATNLLTYDSGVVYSCTNLGAIAASRGDQGQPLWIATYECASQPIDASDDHAFYRSPNPCVFHRGMLYVLPTDSLELLALDALTGIVRWRHKMVSPAGQIVGITGGRLLVHDDGLRTFDLRTGEPLVHLEDLKWFGHPAIVSQTVYWPTNQAILAVDIETSNVAETHLQLPESGGANLLVVGKTLVAAGSTQMTVYRAQEVTSETSPTISEP